MTLDRDSWQRIQSHFDELIELEPGPRREALAELDLSADDMALLRSLLKAHEKVDPLLQSESAPELLALADPLNDASAWSGRQLGPWAVGEQIGRGGMSVVHRGHRSDGQFDKTVAIKVLDAEQLAAEQQHRLVEEIRILARLEHPGLARLIDSGQSDNGDPYLVMEYVNGMALHDYANARALSASARIELIIQVALALQYAHQRQVIHCDIKPSNILVTEQGQVKVVDFGIAALEQIESQDSTQPRLYCSPAYAAPERLRGAAPTTSQDIFSLGAVLYRVLSGRGIRPHDGLTGSNITEQPTPPSIATTQSLSDEAIRPIEARELKGDLDAICMKAIAINAEDRYSSLSELISDLQAWRDHRPVLAREGGRGYVLRRWLRRHTAIAVLGLLLVTALISGTVIALDQARKASLEAERALAARDFLVSILQAADPTLEYGSDPRASELLRRGADRIDTELAAQPELLIDLLAIIANAQLERGLIDDARTSLELALEILPQHTDHPQRPAILASRGLVAYEQGDYSESIDWLAQAVAAAERQPIAAADRHRIKIQLADMLVVNSQPSEALALTTRVLDESPALTQKIAALRAHGGALELSGQLEPAEQTLLQALNLQMAKDPQHVFVALIESDLGIVYWRMGDLERSAEMNEAAWHHKQAIYGNDHPQTLSSLGNVAMTYSAMGDYAAAEQAFTESLAALKRVHSGGVHPDIAYTYGSLALVQYWQEQGLRAQATLDLALNQFAESEKSDPSMVTWLPRLEALLAMERGENISVEALEVSAESCQNLDTLTALSRRLCLAWWWLSSEPPAACPGPAPPAMNEGEIASWPERWQSRWIDIQRRCPRQI